MTVNIRNKGQRGEREIVDWCNDVYREVHELLSMQLPPKPIAQRRQNQSAVGGMDIDNTCGYAFEIKRQETLKVNTWWEQCVISASETGKRPVLLYKQSRKPWQVVLLMNPYVHNVEEYNNYLRKQPIRAQISLEDFREIFRAHVIDHIKTTGGYV